MTLRTIRTLGFALLAARVAASQAPGTIDKGEFRFAYDARGISMLANAHDPFGATIMPASGGRGGRGAAPSGPPTLGLAVSYRAGSDTAWTVVASRNGWSASPDRGTVTYTSGAANAPLRVTETYATNGQSL